MLFLKGILNKIFIQREGKHSKGIIPKDFMKNYLPEDPIIVEAGAHIGIDTIEFSKVWPKGKIHAFEPIPVLYTKLVNNINHCQNVYTYRLALSNKEGVSKIFVSSGKSDASSSLLKPKEHLNVHPDVNFNNSINVNTTTLEKWAASQNIDRIDFLWLDLQGNELNVLKAATNILKTTKIIYTEVSLIETYENVPLYKELKDWLQSQGFIVKREELPWRDMGNVLFIKNSQNGDK